MDWRGRRQSSNVEDRRGMSGGKMVAGGGIVGIIIYLAVTFLGGDPNTAGQIANQLSGQGATTESTTQAELTPEQKQMGELAATVLGDTEDVWGELLKNSKTPYRDPKMVLFSNQVQTGCGAATAAVGPFYCPADEKVYIDLEFFKELYNEFGAKPGDFAVAYVIAHEVGHHVQKILGINAAVEQESRNLSAVQRNKLSVAQELQADFFAGVFANHIKKYLDAHDIDIAMSAAQSVGDDAIQKRVNGQVNPDSFTHGTSAQRKEWFMKGFTSGDYTQGNTFAHLNEF